MQYRSLPPVPNLLSLSLSVLGIGGMRLPQRSRSLADLDEQGAARLLHQFIEPSP